MNTLAEDLIKGKILLKESAQVDKTWILQQLASIIETYASSNDPYRHRETSARGGNVDAAIAKEEGQQDVCDDINALIKEIKNK